MNKGNFKKKKQSHMQHIATLEGLGHLSFDFFEEKEKLLLLPTENRSVTCSTFNFSTL